MKKTILFLASVMLIVLFYVKVIMTNSRLPRLVMVLRQVVRPSLWNG